MLVSMTRGNMGKALWQDVTDNVASQSKRHGIYFSRSSGKGTRRNYKRVKGVFGMEQLHSTTLLWSCSTVELFRCLANRLLSPLSSQNESFMSQLSYLSFVGFI